MFFLLRAAFWFSLVLLALPLGSGGESVGPLQALAAAREAVGDVAGLCERKPEVCVTGRAAFQTIGARARAVTEIASTMIDDGKAGEPDRTISTGTVAPKKPAPKTAIVPQHRPNPIAAD